MCWLRKEIPGAGQQNQSYLSLEQLERGITAAPFEGRWKGISSAPLQADSKRGEFTFLFAMSSGKLEPPFSKHRGTKEEFSEGLDAWKNLASLQWNSGRAAGVLCTLSGSVTPSFQQTCTPQPDNVSGLQLLTAGAQMSPTLTCTEHQGRLKGPSLS